MTEVTEVEDNVLKFPGVETIDYDLLGEDAPVDNVIDAAKEQDLTDVIVLGHKSDGELYFATTSADAKEILYDLEKAKFVLMFTVLGI